MFLEGDRGYAFLVQERGTPEDPFAEEHDPTPKGSGWNLPGGRVEGSIQDIIKGIEQQVEFRRIKPGSQTTARVFRQCLHLADTPETQRIVLTAVKEVLEEAGILVSPISVSCWAQTPSDTIWLVRARQITLGDTTRGGDVKIIASAWHPVAHLPKAMFRRARNMVRAMTKRGASS